MALLLLKSKNTDDLTYLQGLALTENRKVKNPRSKPIIVFKGLEPNRVKNTYVCYLGTKDLTGTAIL